MLISLRLLQAIVHEYPAFSNPTRVEPLGAAGGLSGAQFWQVELASGTFALRRWPTEHPTSEQLRFIHEVLFHAARHGIVILPLPVRTASGQSFIHHDGHLWEITPWIPGVADYQRSPSVQKLAAAMTALATFHVAVSDFPAIAIHPTDGGAPAVSRRLSRLRELLSRGTDELSQAVNAKTWPELFSLAHRFLGTLTKILPRAIRQLEPLANVRLPLQPCIRDVWHDHVLFSGDEVSGLIDFGAMDIDTPATDVSRLLSSLVGDDQELWRTGLDAYSSVRPLSENEILAVKALDLSSTILAGCNWLKWIYVENRQFEDRPQIVERFRRIVARCEFAAASSSIATDLLD